MAKSNKEGQKGRRTDVLSLDGVSRETLQDKSELPANSDKKKKAQLDAVRKKGGIADDDPYDFNNPGLSELYRSFRSNKLSPLESGFNALYLWCYDNYYSSDVPVKSKYKNIYAHPSAWFQNAHHMWRHNKWSVIVKILDVIPKISHMTQVARAKRQDANDKFLNTMEYSHKSAKKSVSMLIIIASIGGAAVMAALFGDAVISELYGTSPALQMFIDGEYVGDVLSITDAERARSNTEKAISSTLGTAYKLDCSISYKTTTISKGSHKNLAGIERAFKDVAHKEMKNGYGLYSYNTLVAVAENKAWLEDSMQESLDGRLTARQKADSSIERLHFNGFVIRENSYPENYFCSLDDIRSMFSLPPLQDGEVQASYVNEISDYLNISASAPILMGTDTEGGAEHLIPIETVVTKTVTEIEPIPYGTIIEYDSNLPENKKTVTRKGRNGSKSVVYLAEYVGNIQKSKKALAEGVVIYEPQSEIITQGTRPLTEEEKRTMSTGTYIFPSPGPINSDYSWRSWGRYNEFHKGTDFGKNNGLDIIASDGGTVIQAKNRGDGYGLCILIEHDDGTITRYAHCSRLLVKDGQKVAQGEKIAIMGSTGNSTGVHLHFEIIKDGNVVNPMEYLTDKAEQ